MELVACLFVMLACWERRKIRIKFWSGSVKERDLSEDLGADRKIRRMDLREVWWKVVDWKHLTQDGDQ